MPPILVADIGGTNSRFALFNPDQKDPKLLRSIHLKTKDAQGLGDLFSMLAREDTEFTPKAVETAVIALAGPVEDGVKCDPPNIDWSVDLTAEGNHGFKRLLLINDFAAQAYACISPLAADAEVIHVGEPSPTSSVAVIGAGTGLGKCLLTPIPGSKEFALVPSEGGHTDFPFVGDEEIAYYEFLLKETGRTRIIGDFVLGGQGFSMLHRFLTGQAQSPVDIAAELTDASPTTHWYARLYGRAARNYALETTSFGGVYISGGIAGKNPLLVRHDAFISEFLRSETHAGILSRIPVLLNKNEDFGLWGAAYYGRMHLKTQTDREDL